MNRIGIGIIIVSFTWFLLRIIDFTALVLEQKAAATADRTDDQLVTFFRDFLKVIVGIISLLLVIKACFNQPIGGLLTSLSIVGAAMALAAKESLENLIASFIIFFDKPFTTGDIVKVNAVTGTVERVGLRSTRIRTIDKTLVTVPNKQMVDSMVDNLSLRTQWRGEIKLELAVQTPGMILEQVITALKKLLTAHAPAITDYNVFFSDMAKTGNTITAEYFTAAITPGDFNSLKETVFFEAKKITEEKGLTPGAIVYTEVKS